MKCPKCGYLGFETGDRCRNCGYDFSFSARPAADPELPLRERGDTGGLPEDFALGEIAPVAVADSLGGLDLDRLIGVPPVRTLDPPVLDAASLGDPEAPRAEQPQVIEPEPEAPASPEHTLPLFSPGDDDTPLITAPRPPRAPLAVRRASPEVPRTRTRTTRPIRRDEPGLALELDRAGEPAPQPAARHARPDTSAGPVAASKGARIAAAVIDVVLLSAIDALVFYFTLRIVELTLADAAILPIVPMAAFLLLLNGGYLVAFTAGGGQTIGKMTTGIRVIGDDGRPVDVPGAVLRAAGCALSALTACIGYLPAFLTIDGRALHDRISGTRVVKA